MTEVRRVSPASVGLFATKDYKTGDVILPATPSLIRLSPASLEEEQTLWQTYFSNEKTGDDNPSLLDAIDITLPDGWLSSTAEDADLSRKTLQTMVQSALCYVHSTVDSQTTETLLQLYQPPLSDNSSSAATETICSEEEKVVRLSSWALDFLKALATDGTPTLKDAVSDLDSCLQIQKIMLIKACNAFAGGHIYDTFSRINHSCNPNSVVVVDATDENMQELRAATKIRSGEEICISYLASWLYADKATRQATLQREKFFTCSCHRCRGQVDSNASETYPDFAQLIPCPVCHPRVNRQLPEDVQYDDDLAVQYICPGQPCSVCGFDESSPETSTEGAPKTGNDAQASFDKLFETNKSVVAKVVTFMRAHQARALIRQPAVHSIDLSEEEVLSEQLTQHLTVASSVLGAKHWATNLIMLLLLDQTLSQFHAGMLRTANGPEDDDEEDKESDMETIASAIDMLERILRFVNSQKLHLHMGHLLSHVIVGTSRALVSLGDIKSQKYAADWISKLAGYDTEDESSDEANFVAHFESPGVQKVVDTLQHAWQRHPDYERPEKRTKR
jgi:SET domain